MSATQDFVALEWIRGELAKTLQSAQVALEAVAESPDDSSSMRSCLTAIHQVHGTLKMVQLEGPTLLAGEMEAVAQALMNNSVSDVSLGQETLMQAILQLPAYLDRLHREQTDRESNYLPIMNNLRVVRGEDRIPGAESAETETAAGPDLSPLTREPGDQVVNTFFQGNGEGNLPKIRARYQASLAAILKKKDIRENLSMLGKLFTMLDRLCGDSPMGNLAEIGLAVVEGIASGGIRLDNNTATLLRGIDGEIKRLAEEGQEGLSKPIDPELGLNLIALVKSASKDTKNIVAVRNRYKTIAPRQEEVSMGPDDETMSAVARILIEELNAVTDKLDLYVRSEKPDTAELIDLRPNLERISSTMVILGDKAQQSSVARQIEVIKGIEAGADTDEETLLGRAQPLLQIESSLGTLVTDGDVGDKDDFADLDEAQAAVVRETRSGLASAKDAVIDFISSDFDASKISSLPVDLSALRGGLTIVNQPRAGDVLTAAASYVRSQLLEAGVRPELDQMDDLADAITSVDYYLERLLENAGDPYLQMLEVAESAVAKLGFAVGAKPVQAEPSAEPVEEPSAEPVEEPSAEVVEEPSAEPVEEPSAEVVQPSAEIEEEPAEPEEDNLIDDEILEIFIEEAGEVLETLNEFLPAWRENPQGEE
ncbi:MAG: PT domain-containing protein, partial [Proteobacteria bacterium]|nr:PT domain-containing protein [Pseudomonadota bacterium]